MIRSILGYFWKSKLGRWLEAREKDIFSDYQAKEKALIAEMDEKYVAMRDTLREGQAEIEERFEKMKKNQRDIDDLEKRVLDRRNDLNRINDELKVQIRLIEAKAMPDSIWINAFSKGFEKAWDTMLPFMTQGVDNAKDAIRNHELENSFPRLNALVENKVKELGDLHLIETAKVEAKRSEFEMRLPRVTDIIERQKLENFIQVLNWCLEKRNGN
jgi:hypothetical protein